jgi:hypothetical protein
MQKENEFIQYLMTLGVDEATVESTLRLCRQYLDFSHGRPQEEVANIQEFVTKWVVGTDDAFSKLLALARFCKFHGNNEALIHLLTSANTLGVVESMEKKLRSLYGDEKANEIFKPETMPPLGTSQDLYPHAVNSLLSRMQGQLTEEECKKVLIGNHHDLNPEQFAEDRRKFQELGSLDAYLSYRHQKTITDMERCLANGTIWYEQKITREVIDFLKENQEVQTGVQDGNRILITKIPYKVDEFLKEPDPVRKRYLACHCPFVRSSLLEGHESVSDLWCNCTGGFTKLPFEVIYGQELEVELLESELSGGTRCRFAIHIPY